MKMDRTRAFMEWGPLLIVCWSLATCSSLWGQTDQSAHAKIRQQISRGNSKEAISAATELLKTNGDDVLALRLRAEAHESLKQFELAIEDWNRVIELTPESSQAYQSRGLIHFKNAEVKESIVDFDRYLKSNPQREPQHWQRGISYFYSREFEKGARQFELYQPVGPTDVENAVWHFLCNAGLHGVEAARKDLIEVRGDRRPWASTVYDLFRGEVAPGKVVAIVTEKSRGEEELRHNLYYAHLYVGLYYDVSNQPDAAKKQVQIAQDKYMISHYMGDVSRVHLIVRGQ